MSRFDFLISPTSRITAYAVDEATSGSAGENMAEGAKGA
jgi:hypothetical protein